MYDKNLKVSVGDIYLNSKGNFSVIIKIVPGNYDNSVSYTVLTSKNNQLTTHRIGRPSFIARLNDTVYNDYVQIANRRKIAMHDISKGARFLSNETLYQITKVTLTMVYYKDDNGIKSSSNIYGFITFLNDEMKPFIPSASKSGISFRKPVVAGTPESSIPCSEEILDDTVYESEMKVLLDPIIGDLFYDIPNERFELVTKDDGEYVKLFVFSPGRIDLNNAYSVTKSLIKEYLEDGDKKFIKNYLVTDKDSHKIEPGCVIKYLGHDLIMVHNIDKFSFTYTYINDDKVRLCYFKNITSTFSHVTEIFVPANYKSLINNSNHGESNTEQENDTIGETTAVPGGLREGSAVNVGKIRATAGTGRLVGNPTKGLGPKIEAREAQIRFDAVSVHDH